MLRPSKKRTKGRVAKRCHVGRRFAKGQHRKALPCLLEDFENRCAYSMEHIDLLGSESYMHVDHFDPRPAVTRKRNAYRNLFPATGPCNNKKTDSWPSRAEQADGVRFIDPSNEHDYGSQIFEDPNTHLLIGTTPAAIFQIEMIGLNSRELVNKRRERSELIRRLTKNIAILKRPGLGRTDDEIGAIAEIVAHLQRELSLKIPEIPSPPAP